jgi:hypothetical protein
VGTYTRQATFTGAVGCKTLGQVNGTPQVSDLESLFGGYWIEAGTLAGQSGTDAWLTGVVTSGSWGSLPVAGTWALDPGFWTLYPRGVISFHLGNAGGDPDWFFFEIGEDITSGSWSVIKLSGSGGGFSNMVLWADPGEPRGLADTVPEPATLVMLATGLIGAALLLLRRRLQAARSNERR